MNKYAKTKQEDTIYSVLEMIAIRRFNKMKIFLLNPLVVLLNKMGVTPNMVSFFSAFIVITGFIFYYAFANPIYFIIGIFVHLILDSVDGTLARFQKTQSKSGAIVDAACDHFGIILSSVFIYMLAIVESSNIFLFAVLYSILIGITLILLKNKQSYLFIIRPRLYVYVAMTVDIFFLIHVTYYVVLVANMIMLVEVILGIIKILSLKKIHL